MATKVCDSGLIPYIFPPFSPELLYTILKKITPHCPTKLLIMRDFNSLSPDLDRSTAAKSFLGDLSNWALAAGLTETWRWKHGHSTVKPYSCFSSTHKSSSRIDLAFANPSFLVDVLEANCLSSRLSDHCPLELVLQTRPCRNGSLWLLGTLWISHPDISGKTPPALQEY